MRKNGKAIESSIKDFKGRGQLYAHSHQALCEFWDNGFSAKGVRRVHTEKFQFNGNGCLAVMNDGEFFAQKNMEEALRRYGCESANTPGNKNGAGMKMASSYFIGDNLDSFMVIVSKSKCGSYSHGLIGSDGNWFVDISNFDDAPDSCDLEFCNCITEKFLSDVEEGTVVGVYNASHLNEFDINKYERILNERFNKGLKDVMFTINKHVVEYFDLFYDNIDPKCTIPNLRWKKSVVFQWESKIFECDLEILNLDTLKSIFPNSLSKYDLDAEGGTVDDRLWGVVAGFDNGYTPLNAGKLWLLGIKTDGHLANQRARIVAKIKDSNESAADVKDWQKLFDQWGALDQAKVQRESPCKKVARGKGSDVVPQYGWENIVKEVVEKLHEQMNKWRIKGDNTYQPSELDAINSSASVKKSFWAGGKKMRFNFVEFSTLDLMRVVPDGNGFVIELNSLNDVVVPMIGKRVSKTLDGFLRGLELGVRSFMQDKQCTNENINLVCDQFNGVAS